MSALNVEIIPLLSDNYAYLIQDDETGTTAVIDPTEAGPVLEKLQELGLPLNYVLNTHHHWDHVAGNDELKAKTGCRVVGAEVDADRIPGIDERVSEATGFQLGNSRAEVLFIPGHTRGHIAYYFRDSGIVFTGDTLFSLGCGKLFEGTPEQMWTSLQKIAALPPETLVYCGHEYTFQNCQFALVLFPKDPELKARLEELRLLRSQNLPSIPTLISIEKQWNPFLRAEEPAMKERMGLKEGTAVQVFAELRRRKDAAS